MINILFRQSGAALRMLLLATVALGLVYPLVVWGVSRVPGLHRPAEGSVLIAPDGTAAGSALIGVDPVPADPAADPYFHTRPSASAKDVLGPGDPSTSGGSNQGGFSDKLRGQVEQRRAAIAAREGAAPATVPADAVTASASGLDPHISLANARMQVARVAAARKFSQDAVNRLVEQAVDGPGLGILGDPGVNVLRLNLSLDRRK